MTIKAPQGVIDTTFSSPDAKPTPWDDAREILERAEVFWLSTVRPDGRPHVTPLLAVWNAGVLHFCTGPDERKAHNLAGNPHCVLTTGENHFSGGLDIVVEGSAARVTDEVTLRDLAALYATKYPGWEFDVRDGAFLNDHSGTAYVYGVAPRKVFGFGKGDVFSQTRWTF